EEDVALLEQPRNDAHLAGAKLGLDALFEDFGDGHLRSARDFLVAVDELAAQAAGQATADGGLACAHHAHEHERLAIEPVRLCPGAALPCPAVCLAHQLRPPLIPLSSVPSPAFQERLAMTFACWE